jgi:hypothetical protein
MIDFIDTLGRHRIINILPLSLKPIGVNIKYDNPDGWVIYIYTTTHILLDVYTVKRLTPYLEELYELLQYKNRNI